MALGGATAISLPGLGYDTWHIDGNTIFCWTNAILVQNVSADAYYWGGMNNNVCDANKRTFAFLGRSAPRNATINSNNCSPLLSVEGIPVEGVNTEFLIIVSTTELEVQLEANSNGFSGARATAVAINLPNTVDGKIGFVGNTIDGLGTNGDSSLNFGVIATSPNVRLNLASNTIDGVFSGGGLSRRGISVGGIKSLIANGNLLARLDLGSEVSGAVSGNVILSGDSAETVTTPRDIAGVVSGVTKDTKTNSWNDD